MPLSDFMPRLREGNMWTNYRNVLGVPIRKRMVIAVIAVFVLFLVFVCAFILAKSDRRSPSSGAAYLTSYVPISSAMNLSVDPCSDFYEFTCGLWGKSQPIHSNDNERVTAYGILKEYFDSKTRAIIENTNTRSEFPAVVNDAITFYKECISGENVDKGDLSYLKSYFEEVLGEWPLFKNSNNTLFDWRKASALLVKTLGVVTIFDMYIVADDYNTSQRILYLRAPDISDLPLGQDESQAMEMLYSVFSALNYDDQPGVYDVIENILDTETEWKKIFSNSTVKSQTLRITFKELNNLIPDMDWLFFFQIAMNDTLNELGTNIKPDDVVQIDSLETIKNAVAFFSSDTLSQKEIANLFGWLAVRKFSCLIPGVLLEYSKLLSYDSNDLINVRRSSCFNFMLEIYSSSIDYLLVKNSSHSCLPVGEVIVDYLKDSLRARLKSSAWLDTSTKQYAKLKLHLMESVIGFRNYLNDKTEFEEVYNNHPRLKPSLLETYIEIYKYFVSHVAIGLKSNPKSAHLMPRPIAAVGAYYNVQKNVFTLPLSIFNPPFFYTLGPMYLNFGALGSIVGHEIMHGFDRKGCKRGKTGSLKEWWSRETSEEYANRSLCFSEQYASYLDHLLPSDLKLRVSNQTRDEDIADNEGLRIAYQAYQQWAKDHEAERTYDVGNRKFSAKQMFFIAFGSVWCTKMESKVIPNVLLDSHTVPKWRVNGAVSNNEHFSEAFNCPEGSQMNPAKKCELW